MEKFEKQNGKNFEFITLCSCTFCDLLLNILQNWLLISITWHPLDPLMADSFLPNEYRRACEMWITFIIIFYTIMYELKFKIHFENSLHYCASRRFGLSVSCGNRRFRSNSAHNDILIIGGSSFHLFCNTKFSAFSYSHKNILGTL